MVYPVDEIAVLVATLLAIAVGSIWYSPLVFGSIWLRATGLTLSDLPESSQTLFRSLSIACITNVVVLYVLAQFIALCEQYAVPSWGVVVALIALITALLTSMVVWEKKTVPYLLIHAGYAAVVLVMGAAIIIYWPW